MSETHDLVLPPVSEENLCLPLAINAVSKYWNIDLPMAEAADIAKKYSNINGSILVEGIELAERHGLGSLILHSSLKELKRYIDMGIPPIVILPGVHDVVQHATVISGYDESEKSIILYIPETNKDGVFQVGVISESQFDKLWEEDGRLLIILAPSDILVDIKNQNTSSAKSNRLCFESEKYNLQGQKEKAIQMLQDAISLDNQNSTAYSLLGGFLNEQNSSDCQKYYEKSIEINNKCYLAYRGLGNFFLKRQDYAKSEEYYSKAIEINPTRFGPIFKNRGFVRLQQNNKKGAKEDFQNYLKFTPNAKDKQSINEAIKEI